jgi:hypothetical protein
MRCYINYKPQQLIPIGRLQPRCIYESIVPNEQAYLDALIKYKKKVIQSKNAQRITTTARYSYLINNPPKTYGTQTEVYTNPNTLGSDRVNATTISINNNPTCPNVYPIDNPLAFPVNQPSVIYPIIPPATPPPSNQCVNYTALDGGTLISKHCVNI